MHVLEVMIDQGYISSRESGDGRTVLNYTHKAAFDRIWNNETKTCRGLVYKTDNQDILGRPFQKFFTLEEYLLENELPKDPFFVSEKMDGSLIIAYSWNGGIGLNTRGSFTSAQALAAGDWLYDAFPTIEIDAGDTWCLEWVSPQNRIVVDYPYDELVLLDIIDNFYGYSVLASKLALQKDKNFYRGIRVAQSYEVESIDELVGIERENHEGFVIKYHNGLRLKIKHSEYVRLHRILTGVTEKTIWEYLANNDSDAREFLIENAPDEFYKWIKKVEEDLRNQALAIEGKVRKEFQGVLQVLPDGYTRKDFALTALKSPNSSMLFALLDDNQEKLQSQIWKMIKPKEECVPSVAPIS